MPQDLFFYNTMTRQIDKFEPLNGNTVQMYCCGPTVYNYAHIGNLRTYVFEDVLDKTIRMAGYGLTHVMNITDVGHLTSDADEGEDKMLIAAKRERLGVLEIARKYEDKFFSDTKALNIRRPDVVARATEHIEDMIKFVKTLEDKGFAYFSNGNVYFDTAKFEEYGKLSKQDREDLKHGARVEEDASKCNPSDFVLWFTSSKFENQILQWDSPWGRGYPGWHIECSTMAMKYLGERVDIHCGGVDHIPVHHENEIAQSEAYLGHEWVHFWMHGEFLQLKNAKMSKSSGTFLTLDSLLEKGYKPEHYRYFCLQSHYRSQANFSFDALDAAKNAYENLKDKIIELKQNPFQSDDEDVLSKYIAQFDDLLFHDLKTPQALAVMWEALKTDALSNASKLCFAEHMDTVFSLGVDKISPSNEEDIPLEVQELAKERLKARSGKNWQRSDELRDAILQKGYIIKDLPAGQFELNKKN